jgi:RNA polymerase sigma-70 factor (ECF subfamily)
VSDDFASSPSLLTRDEEHFTQVLRIRADLLGFIVALVRDFDHAEDILQDTLLELYRCRDRYDGERDFARWAKGVARNLVLRFWAARSRDAIAFEPEALAVIADTMIEEDEGQTEDFQLQVHQMQECLGRLTDRNRRLFVLRYGRNLKGDVLAAASGFNGNSVRTTLLRIRTFLRRCMRHSMLGGKAETLSLEGA